ncbi:conserved hypothetical protein [Clostridium neonatale]|uniref:glycosyltransferase n=1 Tax=Clostridium neonatale TaxID=137838 RepID=UPI001D8BC263|nr:glycosyltransferase [Clostridium neonatale]CAG9713311.1 conserved hypothetical protein [Clostridium neonatale]
MKPNCEVLQIQTVLYHNEPNKIIKSIESILCASKKAIEKGIFRKIILKYGDGSSIPIFSNEELEDLQDTYKEIAIEYINFGANFGSAKGHNTLAKDCGADYIVVMNPDVIMSADTLCELYRPYYENKTCVGMVEARQLPIEHPKDYNIQTGETSWASTACTIFPKKVFDEVGGFDSNSFFLYCDDVDFSWRVRLAGYKVIFQPSAFVFHNKLLSQDAGWQVTSAEAYYSAEASLFLAYKWSRSDILKNILTYFENSNEDYLLKAANKFRIKESAGELPKQLDHEHKVAEFINNNYGIMRFSI